MPVKTVVCLANSRKLSGRCLAGKVYDGSTFGEWIRPVSDRPSEEVSEKEREYQDGSDPKTLDIIRIPLLEPRPKTYQSENWLLDPGFYWVRAGTIDFPTLLKAVDAPASLWLNGQSTYHGLNDRVPEAAADDLNNSLYLLHVHELTLQVFAPNATFGNTKRRVHGLFQHAGTHYALWVTDPLIEREYLGKPDGTYKVGSCVLTVSLGERLNGFCYKLIAAVMRAS
jgi:hypothetical protein